MADQLTTIARVKARLGITDATDDSLISDLIDEATEVVQGICRRRFIPEAGVTLLLDSAVGSVVHVPRGIRAVSSLGLSSADAPDDGSGTYTPITASRIVLYPPVVRRRPGWPADRVLITGAAPVVSRAAINGWKLVGDVDFAATPAAIRAVVEDAVVGAYPARQAGDDGGSSMAIGGGDLATTLEMQFADDTAQGRTLRRYRAGSRVGIA